MRDGVSNQADSDIAAVRDCSSTPGETLQRLSDASRQLQDVSQNDASHQGPVDSTNEYHHIYVFLPWKARLPSGVSVRK